MNLDSREDMAKECLPLLERVVARERKKIGVAYAMVEEMRSFAMEGLACALDSFDESRNVAFKTYAEKRMRWAIYDGLCESGWFPRRLRRKINFYRKASEMLQYQQDTPAPKDKVEAVHRMSDTLKDLATAYITSYAAGENNEPATSPPVTEEDLDRRKLSSKLGCYIDTLPEKQAFVVRCYFFEETKLSVIAKRLGVGTPWASKLLSGGLKRLRLMMDGQDGANSE